MTARSLILALAATLGVAAMPAAAKDERVYELLRYTAAPGKFDALTALVKDQSLPAMKRHGFRIDGAFVPMKNDGNNLYLLVSHASAEARKTDLAAFQADDEWKKARAARGDTVAKVERLALVMTDYSPDMTKLAAGKPGRVFELRTYIATPNNLGHLNARFRDHTVKLFEKYGMTNVAYFNLAPGEREADKTLVYLLAHDSDAARAKSFDQFRQDPDWVAARTASEKAGGGSLTAAKDGVKSVVLLPLDFSPAK